MRLQATLERLEALVEQARDQQTPVISLRDQIAELYTLYWRVDPSTRARIERLVLLVSSAPQGGVIASGAPRFKQWTCAAFGSITNNATGAPAFKKWTCVALGSIGINATGAPLTKKWTCVASGAITLNATGAPLTKKWTCAASGGISLNATGAPNTKKWTCVASGNVVFNPPPGLSIWLMADAGVTLSGSDVTAWADQSGNAHNFQQTSAVNRPTFNATAINGKPGVLFTAAGSQFLLSTASNIARDWLLQEVPLTLNYTAFAVIINNSTAALNATTFLSPALIADDPASGGDNIGMHIGNDKFGAYHWIGSVAVAAPVVSTATPIQVRDNWDNVSANLVGKTPSATATRGATGAPSSVSNGTGIVVGASAAPRAFYNGYIGELMWFNRALTPTEITQVEGYLSAKWGV